MKGYLLSEDDFVVEEVIDHKFLRRFSRKGNKVLKPDGFFLYLLKKRGLSTEKALNFLSLHSGIPASSIGYAGLKDSFARTTQYVTFSRKIDELRKPDMSIEFVKTCSNMISVGDLRGNKFSITLHDCSGLRDIGKKINDVRKGFPNYFGPQRFAGRNHFIGKKILKEGKSSYPKEKTKFFIHAYQSYLFNMLVERYPDKSVLPIVGYKSRSRIARCILDEVGLKNGDFRISQMSLTCDGGTRQTIIRPENIEYEIKGNTLKLEFFLPKGSYATVLLSQLGFSQLRKQK